VYKIKLLKWHQDIKAPELVIFSSAIYTPLKILYPNGDFNSTKKSQNGLLEAVFGHYVKK
jgi:hypothetical protein